MSAIRRPSGDQAAPPTPDSNGTGRVKSPVSTSNTAVPGAPPPNVPATTSKRLPRGDQARMYGASLNGVSSEITGRSSLPSGCTTSYSAP